MVTKYLLPCSCGREAQVEIGQAGSSIPCECGLTLNVPTMRGLRALQSVEMQDASQPKLGQSEWGTRQGLILLGLVIAVLAAIPAGYYFRKLPSKPELDVPAVVALNSKYIDEFGLTDSWIFFQRDIVQLGLQDVPPPQLAEYDREFAAHGGTVGMFLAVAALGLLMAIGGLLVPRSPQRTTSS